MLNVINNVCWILGKGFLGTLIALLRAKKGIQLQAEIFYGTATGSAEMHSEYFVCCVEKGACGRPIIAVARQCKIVLFCLLFEKVIIAGLRLLCYARNDGEFS